MKASGPDAQHNKQSVWPAVIVEAGRLQMSKKQTLLDTSVRELSRMQGKPNRSRKCSL